MNKIIPFDEKFEFCFLEQNDTQIQHPLSNYYLKLNDLSINVIISFKWIFWGFKFFNSIAIEINKPEYSIDFNLNKEILQKWDFSKKKKNILFFNDKIVQSEIELINLIVSDYDLSIFDENTKIHIKLTLNLDEFLLINNTYFPVLAPFEEII